MTEPNTLGGLIGGALIGLATVLLLGLNGRIAGISGFWAGLSHRPVGATVSGAVRLSSAYLRVRAYTLLLAAACRWNFKHAARHCWLPVCSSAWEHDWALVALRDTAFAV
jgi:hypothetical protein